MRESDDARARQGRNNGKGKLGRGAMRAKEGLRARAFRAQRARRGFGA